MTDQASEGMLSTFLRRQRLVHALPFVDGRVLDFGCGTGELCRVVAPAQYLGVETDPHSLSIARRRFPRHKFSSTLPEGESFDTVVALAVLEHVERPEALLLSLRGCLAGNGCIVVTTPHPAVGSFHRLGARVGLFSAAAAREHRALLDSRQITGVARQAGLRVLSYSRFLLGMNQLVILGQ